MNRQTVPVCFICNIYVKKNVNTCRGQKNRMNKGFIEPYYGLFPFYYG